MELINESGFEVAVPRIDLGHDQVAVVAIVKAVFDLRRGGGLSASAERMPLVKHVLATPHGVFHSEFFFKKHGVDLCVLGDVRRSTPIREARVRLMCGHRVWELAVRGDRRWERRARGGALTPSAPEPFTTMPLAYSRAFGGKMAVADTTYGYPANPEGRGYFGSREEAENQLLSNIEDARRAPAQTWQPGEERPTGWAPYPNFWALRAAVGVGHDPKSGAMTSLSPALFNHAHPDLVLESIEAGQSLVIDGLWDERIECRIPASPATVAVSIGTERRLVEAPIDGLFLWTEHRKLVVTQRARFHYRRRPEELRRIHVQRTGHP